MKVLCCVKVWTENKKKDGATNFITGMGGFLQALLFGYGGVRLREKSLELDPVLLPGCSEMRFMGVDYMSSSISLTVVDRNMTITLTSAGRFPLRLLLESQSIDLVLNQPVIVNRTKAHITVIQQQQKLFYGPLIQDNTAEQVPEIIRHINPNNHHYSPQYL